MPPESEVHPSVLGGFGRMAEAYERGRPTYPAAAIEWIVERLGVRPGATVVDLAAGTGKLTRLLVPTGARVVAVEPVEGMRKQLARTVPNVEVFAGAAERMPLPDRSADAVTVAQAFHWFANDRALAEIARVLRPGGHLGLIWNTRDERDAVQQELTSIIEPLRGTEHTHVGHGWRRVVEANPFFGPLEEATFSHEQRVDAGMLADRVGSISFIAVLPDGEREQVLDRVRALVGDREVTLQYVTQVYAAPSVAG